MSGLSSQFSSETREPRRGLDQGRAPPGFFAEVTCHFNPVCVSFPTPPGFSQDRSRCEWSTSFGSAPMVPQRLGPFGRPRPSTESRDTAKSTQSLKQVQPEPHFRFRVLLPHFARCEWISPPLLIVPRRPRKPIVCRENHSVCWLAQRFAVCHIGVTAEGKPEAGANGETRERSDQGNLDVRSKGNRRPPV